jgi:hypothetical protein
MRIIDPKALAATAAERWKYSYWRPDGRGWIVDFASGVHAQLLALGANPDPEDVNRIIGNKTWTQQWCNEPQCGGVAVVEVGQEPDYESSTANLCRDCLKKVAALVGL